MSRLVEEMGARIADLEERLSSMSLPDYLPVEVKIEDWRKMRELAYREKELDIEVRRLKELGSGYIPASVVTPPSNEYEDRLSKAKQQGFTWPTRGGTAPARLSTRERMLSSWEKEYAQGLALTDSELSDISKVGRIGAGAIRVAVDRLDSLYGNQVDTEGLNLYNKYQKLAKAAKPGKVTVVAPLPVPSNAKAEALRLRDLVFGTNHNLDESDNQIALDMFTRRIENSGGLSKITPDQIKECLNLRRLPVFITWDEDHISPSARLSAIKEGKYDMYFEELVQGLAVESQ